MRYCLFNSKEFFSEIGVGLAGFGISFLFLGVLLLFDKGLLAIGNVSLYFTCIFICLHKHYATITSILSIALIYCGARLCHRTMEDFEFLLSTTQNESQFCVPRRYYCSTYGLAHCRHDFRNLWFCIALQVSVLYYSL